MEIIPIEYCDVTDTYIHLNQTQSECAFEHQCDSMDEICPLKNCFDKKIAAVDNKEPERMMPEFYISNL